MGDETEPAIGLILSAAASPQPSSFLLRAIPSELGRTADLAGFLDIVATKMERPFERLLYHLDAEEEGRSVAVLVANTYVLWVVVVNLVPLRLWPPYNAFLRRLQGRWTRRLAASRHPLR
jgi:hypothetical protein